MLVNRLRYNLTFSKQNKALLNAAKNQSDSTIDKIEQALDDGADIDVRDVRNQGELNWIGYNYTPLMWSVHNGHLDKIKYLISRGADVYAKTGRDNTILHIAARGGYTHIVEYLADHFPDLLYEKDQNHCTPQELAEKYKKEDTVQAFNANYSNAFFGSIKRPIPDEMTMLIASHVKDPISLKNLSIVNHAWNNLFQDEDLVKVYQNSLRSYLPSMLHKDDWKGIFTYYYPHLPVPRNPFQAFIQSIHTYYCMGDSITLLTDKHFGERMIESIFLSGLTLAHQANIPSDKKYKEISLKEMKASCDAMLARKELEVYRDLQYLSGYERKHVNQDNRYQPRQPIFEIMVNNETALKLLHRPKGPMWIAKKDIIGIRSWRMANQDYAEAEQDEAHQVTFRTKV